MLFASVRRKPFSVFHENPRTTWFAETMFQISWLRLSRAYWYKRKKFLQAAFKFITLTVYQRQRYSRCTLVSNLISAAMVTSWLSSWQCRAQLATFPSARRDSTLSCPRRIALHLTHSPFSWTLLQVSFRVTRPRPSWAPRTPTARCRWQRRRPTHLAEVGVISSHKYLSWGMCCVSSSLEMLTAAAARDVDGRTKRK